MNKYPPPIIMFAALIITLAIGIAIGFLLPSKGSANATRLVVEPYFHSYEEMQEWAEVPVDGHWGPISDAAYTAKRDRVYCDKMAALTFEVK